MPKYKYLARDKRGKKVTEVIESETREQAARYVGSLGYTPITISDEHDLPGWNTLHKFYWGKLKALGVFTRQLATLVKSGLPLARGLNTLEEQADKKYMADAIKDVLKDVENGIELNAALKKHPDIFNRLYINMVKVGEASGNLDEVLLNLANLIEYELETRAKMISVLLYPMLAIGAMIIAFIILTVFVLPQIVKIFEGLQGNLPLPTLILLKTNYVMHNYWYVVLAGVISAIIVFYRYIHTKKGRYYWDKFKIKVPLMGNIIFKIIMSRFARVTSILVKSGVPILTVLELTSETAGNVIISNAIDDIRASVREGQGMAGPMKKAGVFSPIILQMVSVGEETGRIDELLNEVAVYYDRDAAFAVEYLATIIEPIIIVVIAAGVLLMALGIFMPMWNTYNLIIQGGTG